MADTAQILRVERVAKFDDELGLVFGWAIICKKLNKATGAYEPYFDLQGDHIPDDVMMKAVVDFRRNSRGLDEMHVRKVGGRVLHDMPITEQLARASSILPDFTGWFVGVEPAAEQLAKFKSGKLGGFSINGMGVRTPMAVSA